MVAHVPHHSGEAVSLALGQFGIIVGDDDDGRPHGGDIGVLVACGDAAGQDAGLILKGDGGLHQRLHGRFARVVKGDVEEQIGLGNGLRRLDVASDRTGQDVRCLHPPLALIDVRIGLVDDQRRGIAHQFFVDVAMIVVGHDDGEVRTDQFTHTAHGFGIGLGVVFGHHRPVQRQQQTIAGLFGSPQRVEKFAYQGFIGLARQRPGRGGVGREERRHLIVVLLGGGDIAGHFVEGGRVDADQILAAMDAEFIQCGGEGGKRIRLVGQ